MFSCLQTSVSSIYYCLDWKVLLCVLKVMVFFFLEKCLINQACSLFSSFAYFRLAVFLLSPVSLKSWASFWVKLSGLNHYRIIPYKFEDYNFFRLMKLRTGISKRYSKINTGSTDQGGLFVFENLPSWRSDKNFETDLKATSNQNFAHLKLT